MLEEPLLNFGGKPLFLLVVHTVPRIHENRRVRIRLPQQVLSLFCMLLSLNQELAVSDSFLHSRLRVLGEFVRKHSPFWCGVAPYQPFRFNAMRRKNASDYTIIEIIDINSDGSDGRNHSRGWLNHEAWWPLRFLSSIHTLWALIRFAMIGCPPTVGLKRRLSGIIKLAIITIDHMILPRMRLLLPPILWPSVLSHLLLALLQELNLILGPYFLSLRLKPWGNILSLLWLLKHGNIWEERIVFGKMRIIIKVIITIVRGLRF